MRTVRDVGQACQRSAPSFPILRVSREEFLYELKAGPAGGLRPPSGPAATRREPGGCRPTLGRVEPNRSSGRELEGSTRRLGRLVEDAIRECLERDRAELNQGEDLPP
jgi:hypothetical protein